MSVIYVDVKQLDATQRPLPDLRQVRETPTTPVAVLLPVQPEAESNLQLREIVQHLLQVR